MTDEIPITDEDLRRYKTLCEAVRDRRWRVASDGGADENDDLSWDIFYVESAGSDGVWGDLFEAPDPQVCDFVVESRRLAPHFLDYIEALKSRCHELFRENRELKIKRNQDEAATEAGALRNEVKLLKDRNDWLEERIHIAKDKLVNLAEKI